MTEGPEATYLRAYVSRYFKGRQLRGVKILSGRYKRHGPPAGFRAFQRALPLTLVDVRKKGKVLFFVFDKDWLLIIRPGMTGWLSRPVDSRLFESQPSVVFQFEGGRELDWSDFRNFGTLTFVHGVEPTAEMDRLAPDVLTEEATPTRVWNRLQRLTQKQRSLSVAEALMDQRLLMSGVGNIIKSEALYDAQLSPRRTLKSLSGRECRRLVASTRKISRKVLRYLEGRPFNRTDYMGLHRVYGRTRNARGLSVKRYTEKDGRSTFWVPSVQH